MPLLQELNIGRIAELCDDLQGGIYLLDSLVDEDVLRIEHLVGHGRVLLLDKRGVIAHDYSLCCCLNLDMAENFSIQWGAVDEEDAREARNSVPDMLWNGLSWIDDDDVLKVVLQVLGPQR